MEKEFIPYEQALALKELGFDEKCFGYFDSKSELAFNTNGNAISKDWVWFGNQCLPVDMTLAPLYQQAFRWFRQKYGLTGWVEGKKVYKYYIENPIPNDGQINFSPFKTNEEAELACIKKLIEIIKSK
jgi:hypothetical protein